MSQTAVELARGIQYFELKTHLKSKLILKNSLIIPVKNVLYIFFKMLKWNKIKKKLDARCEQRKVYCLSAP